jgi:UDP:flavonoid glycosyltransferase YjiC (YdhE family)
MKIVLATFGSLGDLHPKIALGLELQQRGHEITFAAMDFYKERIEAAGFTFASMRPHFDMEDRGLAVELMDRRKGPETMMKKVLFPNLRGMFGDLLAAVEGKDLLVTGEVVYAAKSVVEKTGIPWISTSLAPISFFSASDPSVYPTAEWIETLRFMPAFFHHGLFALMRLTIAGWLKPYREFRRELGLSEDHDPIFFGKNSDLLHLALFSKTLAKPQPDWHRPTLQTGFCFFDGSDDASLMPDGLEDFLDSGDPPIVFTLGSAAVMDARDFFEESARAARILKRRAVLLYGMYNDPPKGLDENIAGFQFAPYSLVFPRAACVVHQGGVGTTAQVLRAGVPHLIMPYGHDQPDNAARCRRAGVAEINGRDEYTAEKAASIVQNLLKEPMYRANAAAAKRIIDGEGGTKIACDAIENILKK